MKKAIIFAAALMVGVSVFGNPIVAQAASANVVIKKVVQSNGTIKDCLENLDKNTFGNCTIITIPCIPEMENDSAQKPETDAPNVPEAEKPETDKPETDKPEGNVPNVPEAEKPETDKPEYSDTESEYYAYVLRVVELVNEERAKAGLQPLTLKRDITAAAQIRAKESAVSFSHTRPDGSHFSTALKEANVSYRGAGENIAWGQKTPEQVMNGWMNSSGHRANILNEKFTAIGVGYYQNESGVNYWSQLFTY